MLLPQWEKSEPFSSIFLFALQVVVGDLKCRGFEGRDSVDVSQDFRYILL